MDDQKVLDLLDKASREYNEGKYTEAIAHWQEVLAKDPGSQKAREGIRMAQLLVVNWEASEGESADGELAITPEAADAESKEKIDVGISRVRELLAEGRYQEALEGCHLLSELAPGMDSVKHLLEEVTQVHEAQPFIKERLDRAKKFIAQGKNKEAAEEARKALSVDKTNIAALAILNRVSGAPAAVAKPKPPSAFQVEKAGKAPPPSPFSGRGGGRESDALLAQFDFEEGAAPGAAPPAAAGAGEPAVLELEPGDADATGRQAAGGDVESKIRALIGEGEKLFVKARYQPAIDTWSRVFALDATNAEAGTLIDRAKAQLEDHARQADEAYFKGVDAFESGRTKEAKQFFEEVVGIHPEHSDAREYLKKIEAKAAPSAPRPEPAPAAKPSKQQSAKAAAEKELIPMESVPLAVSRDEPAHPEHKATPAVSAGPMKKKPVARAPGASRSRTLVLAGVLAVAALGGGGYYVLFVMGGSAPPSPAPAPPADGAAAAALVVEPAGAPGGGGAPAGPSGPTRAGGLEVVPGGAAPGRAGTQAPALGDPAAVKKRVDALIREGHALFSQEKYPEAFERFEKALALDPANFDAEEMRSKAAGAAQKQAKLNRELESAKGAFNDGDWAGALYKLYRLREERKDMAALARYIKNANYNWGIEALNGFELEGAVEHFKDAMEMAPGDAAIQKHLDVAGRYKRRNRDAAFNAYVAGLKPKRLDEK